LAEPVTDSAVGRRDSAAREPGAGEAAGLPHTFEWPANCTPKTLASALRAPTGTQGGNVANVKESLSKILEIDGAIGACVVDSNSGMMLGAEGGGTVVNLEVAAAGNTEVVRAKRKTMKALNLADNIDDILITLGKQYHVIRPLRTNEALFIYLVLDKTKSNLAMARHQLTSIESTLSV
jgi:hypothetical protein